MVTIKREGIILEKTDLEFENEGVMNPAVISDGETVHLFYRAVRQGNYSTIGYCRLNGPLKVVERSNVPLLFPQSGYEWQGVEDPRIVKIENMYYLSYTAYDGLNARGALAISSDFVHFDKQGIITSDFSYSEFQKLVAKQEHLTSKYFRSYNGKKKEGESGEKLYLTDKNLVFFPRKISGKFYFMHRIKPEIQWTAVETLEELDDAFWRDYFRDFDAHILLRLKYPHESSYIGAGCPPVETPEGWLLIYHSVYDTPGGYVYSACAALLDLEDPTVEIARLPYPLFSPEADYELLGVVNQVCFPTGTTLFDGRLYIYYGAADKCVACASVNLQELMNELILNKI